MNELVAVRYDFDGNGYLYMDASSGSDWASRVKNCEFLYTHPPMRELTEDEIKEVADSVCHTWKKNGVGELYMTDFAKAIIKASRGEK
jgi:hypothetical protein